MSDQPFSITVAPYDGWFLKWHWQVFSERGCVVLADGYTRTEAQARSCAEKAADTWAAIRARENQQYTCKYPADGS